MFALVFERDPISFADLPGSLVRWTQTFGVLAMIGIVLWAIFGLPRMRRVDREAIPSWQANLFIGLVILGAVLYSIFGVVAVLVPSAEGATTLSRGQFLREGLLTGAGLCAVVAACLPIFRNIPTIRLRRIFALAKLSFKESLRNRVVHAVSILLIFFLFAGWFIQGKPEDQVRTYVQWVFGVMTVFLLAISVILSAFSIPTDIRNQTIQTVVTKPVERFEIVLGRFLGFTALMSLILFVMSTLSLLYVVRGVDPDAAAESLKARDPLYGELTFEGTSSEHKGESVGREWEYRTYIAGPMAGVPPQYAIWSFNSLPANLQSRSTVRCEYTFDIYRTSKGEENVGIRCSFVFTSWRFQKGDEEKYRAERNAERSKTSERQSDAAIDNMLAKKYGYYEIPSTNVTDYRTLAVQVPAGLFQHAAQPDDSLKADLERRGQSVAPVQVRVKCNSTTQYIGMAKHDLYLRVDNPDSGFDRLWFSWNFYKAAMGLWLRLCLVIALAVILSTYLSGVISLVVTLKLYSLGLFVGFIQDVGFGRNIGGGPIEASLRLVRRDHLIAPLEETGSNAVAMKMDVFYRFFIRLLVYIIPDVESSDLMAYVADGFNIAPGQFVVTCILMFGYLLPWFLLGYYLMKWREIASAN